MSEKNIGKPVVAHTTTPGTVQYVGRIVGYCDAPTYVIRLPNGEQRHWRVDLCKVTSAEEAIATAIFSGDYDELTGEDLRLAFPQVEI